MTDFKILSFAFQPFPHHQHGSTATRKKPTKHLKRRPCRLGPWNGMLLITYELTNCVSSLLVQTGFTGATKNRQRPPIVTTLIPTAPTTTLTSCKRTFYTQRGRTVTLPMNDDRNTLPHGCLLLTMTPALNFNAHHMPGPRHSSSTCILFADATKRDFKRADDYDSHPYSSSH